MSEDDQDITTPAAPSGISGSMKSAFASGKTSSSGVLFKKDEFDIFVNKITMEAYIFHAKK